MAGDWLKFEKATLDKPEVFAIAAELNIDPDAVLGKLLRVWSWFDTHTESGNAKRVTKGLLDRIAGLNGFCSAMEQSGWLSDNDGCILLPSFDKHTGKTAKARAETARRVAQHRVGRTAIPRGVRRSVFERDGGVCVYCGRTPVKYFPPETARDALVCMDHVIPLSRGGSDDDFNLVTACGRCNNEKSNRDPDEAGLRWPEDSNGIRYGKTVTSPLAREEKKTEEQSSKAKATGQQADHDGDCGLRTDIVPPVVPDEQGETKPPRTAPRKAQAAKHFPRFWAAYPVKKGKADAEKKWKSKGCDEIVDQIIDHVRLMERVDDDWLRGFIPHGSTYINGERWTDEPKKDKQATTPAPAPETFGAAAVAARNNTETPLERAMAYIRHQASLGAYGEGEEGQERIRAAMQEAREKHGGGNGNS